MKLTTVLAVALTFFAGVVAPIYAVEAGARVHITVHKVAEEDNSGSQAVHHKHHRHKYNGIASLLTKDDLPICYKQCDVGMYCEKALVENQVCRAPNEGECYSFDTFTFKPCSKEAGTCGEDGMCLREQRETENRKLRH